MGEDAKGRTIALLFVAFTVVWTLYFSITEATSSIHNDMAEAYAWGREFRLGYNQHPPFWAWLCGLWFLVFPRVNAAFAGLACLNAAVGLLGSWRLIGRFADGDKRVAATALLVMTPFYTFLSYKYNANSIFLSIWPWTLLFFLRSIDEGRRRDALAFGAMMGVALLSKYFAGVLAVTILLAALRHENRARYFRSLSPYLSVAVAALIVAPHIYWLAMSGAPPMRYLARVSGQGLGQATSFAAGALAGSFAQNLLAVVLIGIAARGQPSGARTQRLELLIILVLAPLVLSIAAALALRTKISSNMLIGVFSLGPLLAIELFGARGLPRLRTWATRGAVVLSLGALLASPAIGFAKAWYGRDPEDREPRRELAEAATKLWREKTGLPLAYVGGSFRYDNAVAFYSQDRPHVFVRFDLFGNRWVTVDEIVRKGLLSVCIKTDDECLTSTQKYSNIQASRSEVTLPHRAWGHRSKPVDFIVTVIPPASISR